MSKVLDGVAWLAASLGSTLEDVVIIVVIIIAPPLSRVKHG